jgi:putative effector of murein hydrolase
MMDSSATKKKTNFGRVATMGSRSTDEPATRSNPRHLRRIGRPAAVGRSLASKSVTAPLAIGIAERTGGVRALAAVFAVVTGLVGALSGRYIFGALGADPMAVRGFALGTTSHGQGAARAIQVHPDAGAYAGIALGLRVPVASLLMPLVFRWLA